MESSYEQQQQQQQQRYDQPPPSSNNERGPPPSSFDDPSFPRRGAPPPLPTRDEQRAPPTLPKTPIHYDFPVSNFDDNNNNDQHVEFASPRQDLITRYMMTQSGKLQVRTSSTIIGGSIGIFLAKVRTYVYVCPYVRMRAKRTEFDKKRCLLLLLLLLATIID